VQAGNSAGRLQSPRGRSSHLPAHQTRRSRSRRRRHAGLPARPAVDRDGRGRALGGEWGSKAIRQLLCRESRRWRILLAKFISIWTAGAATLLACYLTLAIAAPLFAAQAGLPKPTSGLGLWTGLGPSLTDIARALVVLGLFAVIGTAAGTIGRGQLATTALTAGTMLLAGLAGIAVTAAIAASIARWRFSTDVTV